MTGLAPAVVGVKTSPRHIGAAVIAAIPLSLVVCALHPVGAAADPLFGPYHPYGTGFYPYSVAIGDLSGDAKPDLAVANYESNTVSVLLGNGDGTFGVKTDFATGNGPSSVAIRDLNGDGRLDLAVANFGSCCDFVGSVSILLGNGAGGLAAKTDFPTANGPWSIAIGDLNGDGRPDLATANNWSNVSNSVSVLLGDGNGSFGANTDYVTGTSPRSVAIADLNGDGRRDLAVANGGSDPNYLGTVSVLLGQGDGSFGGKTDFATGNASYSVAIVDLDGDGDRDLAAGNYYGTFPVLPGSVSVLLGDGNGSFGAKTDYVTGSVGPVSIAIGDLNSDGRPDLATANPDNRTTSVLLNISPFTGGVGEPRFGLALLGPVPNPSSGLSVRFTLPGAGPATLVAYDVSGREVGRLEVGGFGAGQHVASLGAPGTLAAGIYLVHLIQREHRLAVRAVVIR